MGDIYEQLRQLTRGCKTFVANAENNPDGGGYCSQCEQSFEMRMDSLSHACEDVTNG